MSHPNPSEKCQAPLLKITGVISGVVTRKEKTRAMPSPVARAKNKATRIIKNFIELGL